MQRPIAFQEPEENNGSAKEIQADQESARRTQRLESQRLIGRRNRRAIEDIASQQLEEAGIEPPSGKGMYRDNGRPDAATKNLKPSPPVRKTSALAFPDGGGMGPLPAPRPATTEETNATKTPAKESARRMAICNACPELIALDRCRRCGCFMRIKTQIPGAQCPLQKW